MPRRGRGGSAGPWAEQSGTASRQKGSRGRVRDAEGELAAPPTALAGDSNLLAQRSTPCPPTRSAETRRIHWEVTDGEGRGVHPRKDPQKGFRTQETRRVSLSTFLNHHFEPQISQLQNGSGSPSLDLVQGITTKVVYKRLAAR